MDTSPFNVFHDAGHEYVVSVTDCVHLQLLALDIFVYQYRLVLVNGYRAFQICAECVLVRDNLHCTTAQYIGRAHQYGIANFIRRLYAVLNIRNSAAFGLRDIQFFHNMLERIAVFGFFDCRNVCPDDFNAALHQRLCKVDCGLSAQRSNDADWLLYFYNIHNVFHS